MFYKIRKSGLPESSIQHTTPQSTEYYKEDTSKYIYFLSTLVLLKYQDVFNLKDMLF